MKKKILTLLCALMLTASLQSGAFARELITGGQAVGIEISSEGVMVAGLADIETAAGTVCPARDAGFEAGDVIIKIGEHHVSTASDFLSAVAALDGKPGAVTASRGGKTVQLLVTPVLSSGGQWLLGMWLKDSLSGIGTLTYVDPADGSFGALGHSINDEFSGSLIPLRAGSIRSASVADVCCGTPGKPGELSAVYSSAEPVGSIEANREEGIFGHVCADIGGRIMDTGQIDVGEATILATVSGEDVKEYSVYIDRVYSDSDSTRALLHVTDTQLENLTGGIVQGMSGSPIIQNGALVGALTHVFINNPMRGCGISIDDMLEAA